MPARSLPPPTPGQPTVLMCLAKHAVVKAEPAAVAPPSPPGRRSEAPIAPGTSGPPEPRTGAEGSAEPLASEAPSQRPPTVSMDKSRYNKLNGKLRIAPQEVRDRYNKLKSKCGSKEFEDFAQSLLSVKGREFPEEFLQQCRTIEDIKENSLASEWMSWKEALTHEDEDILLGALQASPPLLASRPNPRVSPTSSIQWPRNLEVKWVKEGSRELKRKTDATKDVGEVDEDPDSREAFAKKFKADHEPNGVAAHSHSAAPPVQSGVVDPRIKDTCSFLRKAHSAWDRCRRNLDAAIARSQTNANTKGSKVEQDAGRIKEDGDALDAKVQAMERAYLTTNTLTADQIEEAAQLCQDVKGKTEVATKKVAALKSWFDA